LVLLLQEVDKIKSQVASPSQDANPSQVTSSSVRTMAESPAKIRKIFNFSKSKKDQSSAEFLEASTSIRPIEDVLSDELDEFLKIEIESESFEMSEFYRVHKKRFPHVFAAAKRILVTPATSGPIERVFSQGSLIMRPHRTNLSSELLITLMLLKCNNQSLR
jgi:hypothetical protein